MSVVVTDEGFYLQINSKVAVSFNCLGLCSQLARDGTASAARGEPPSFSTRSAWPGGARGARLSGGWAFLGASGTGSLQLQAFSQSQQELRLFRQRSEIPTKFLLTIIRLDPNTRDIYPPTATYTSDLTAPNPVQLWLGYLGMPKVATIIRCRVFTLRILHCIAEFRHTH